MFVVDDVTMVVKELSPSRSYNALLLQFFFNFRYNDDILANSGIAD